MKTFQLVAKRKIVTVAKLYLNYAIEESIIPIVSEWVRDVSQNQIRNYNIIDGTGEFGLDWRTELTLEGDLVIYGPEMVPIIEEK